MTLERQVENSEPQSIEEQMLAMDLDPTDQEDRDFFQNTILKAKEMSVIESEFTTNIRIPGTRIIGMPSTDSIPRISARHQRLEKVHGRTGGTTG